MFTIGTNSEWILQKVTFSKALILKPILFLESHIFKNCLSPPYAILALKMDKKTQNQIVKVQTKREFVHYYLEVQANPKKIAHKTPAIFSIYGRNRIIPWHTAWWAENYSKIKVAQYPFKIHSYYAQVVSGWALELNLF